MVHLFNHWNLFILFNCEYCLIRSLELRDLVKFRKGLKLVYIFYIFFNLLFIFIIIYYIFYFYFIFIYYILFF